ncbi:MAG TPA: protein-glutamate O-methyltransferase CheR, partial [Phycisphaerae bacterium]
MSETPEADDGPEVASADPAPTAQESERALDSAGFDTLLDYLKRARGFDFTAYKRGSLMRRVRRRMQTVAIEDFTRYTDYLEVHPGEFAQLFNTILINVTSFFRDPTAWEYVSQEVIPRILASKGEAGAIRVWSAGCASGEEAYTLAMLLAEHLGHDVFRQRVKIYATDVDEDALNKARHAAYSEKDLESVPAALREKYFGADKGRISFDRALRRNVIFGRHDLLSDPPISRVDLLVCRNTLMYFNTEGQTRILSRFYQALNPDGYLFLGRAEMLIGHANLFAPLELNKRVFIPVSKAGLRDKLVTMAQNGRQEARDHWMTHAHIRDAAV